MDKIRVLVTGAGGGGIGEQITKSLMQTKGKYYVICSDVRMDTIAKKLGDDFILLPSAQSANYIDIVVDFCTRKEIQTIIPGSEPELRKFVENKKLFDDLGIYLPINDENVIGVCSDKICFDEFLNEKGYQNFNSHTITDNTDFDSFLNFPYVIKPVMGSGSTNVFIVQNKSELINICNYIGFDRPMILQQYVGTLDDEYTVGILSTLEDGYVDHIILKRDLSYGLSLKSKVSNRTDREEFGDWLGISSGISQGTFVQNDIISEVVRKITLDLKLTSTINMQCRLFENKVFIFEINPRFSGTTNLRALVGFNEPDYILSSHFGLAKSALDSANWLGKKVLRGLNEFVV
jgi:carbamoyl-phosphate synthase large subunit